MKATRLDILLIGVALTLTALALAWRGLEVRQIAQQASDVDSNIQAVAAAVHQYHEETGQWFPEEQTEDRPAQIYPDPFHHHLRPTSYQGLDERWLWFENNHGMLLQLVRFSGNSLSPHLFNETFKEGEPYLRILLDYGLQEQSETHILMRLERELPQGSIVELDDHYFVIDIRQLGDG